MMGARWLWLIAPALLLAVACGSGSDNAPSATTVPAASTATSVPSVTDTPADTGKEAFATPTSIPDEMCPLLPESDLKRTTGYDLLMAQQRHGPGPLDYCTIYLDIPACNEGCALSLEDLGAVDPKAYNTPDGYRQTLLSANPDAGVTFKDKALGENSWLGTAQSGDLTGFKIAYFQVKDVAYDLTGPRVAGYTLTEAQFLAAAQAVIDNRNK